MACPGYIDGNLRLSKRNDRGYILRDLRQGAFFRSSTTDPESHICFWEALDCDWNREEGEGGVHFYVVSSKANNMDIQCRSRIRLVIMTYSHRSKRPFLTNYRDTVPSYKVLQAPMLSLLGYTIFDCSTPNEACAALLELGDIWMCRSSHPFSYEHSLTYKQQETS